MSQFKGLQHFGQTVRAPVMRWEWKRSTGSIEQVFVCGGYNYLRNTVAPDLVDDYDSIVIEQMDGEMYKLMAAQTGEEITEVYDIHGSNLSQSVLINLTMKEQFIALGIPEDKYANLVSQINDEVQKKKSNGQTYAQMEAAVLALVVSLVDLTQPLINLASDLMDRIDRHGDQFLQAQYSFQHTIILPERTYQGGGDFEYVFDNTHRIFTESQLRDAENVPGTFAIPNSILNNAIPAEWLKQPSHSSMTLNQKRQIVTEYLGADTWDRLTYKVAE